MKLGAWLAAGLTCLALSLGACGGDDDERPNSAYTQRNETTPSQSERDSAPAEDDSGGEAAARSDGSRKEDPDRDRPPRDAAQRAPSGGGRGGNPGQAPRPRASRSVRITVAGFLAAMRAEKARRACAYYTREVRTLVGGTLGVNCAKGMEFVFLVIGPNRPALRRVAITGVELSGDRASADLRLPRSLRTLPMLQLIAPDDRLSLERESGRWRLGLAE
jgi:hypothetical protein